MRMILCWIFYQDVKDDDNDDEIEIDLLRLMNAWKQ